MSIPKTGDRFSVSVFSNLSDEQTQQLPSQLDANDGAQDSFVSVIPKSDSRNGCRGTRSPEFLADFLQANAEKTGVKLSYGEALQITRAVAAEENNADKNITLRNFSDIVLKPQMIALIHEQFPNLDAENVGLALAITLDPQMSIAPPRAPAPKGPMTIPQLMEFVEAGIGIDDPEFIAAQLANLTTMRAIVAEADDARLLIYTDKFFASFDRLHRATSSSEIRALLGDIQGQMVQLRAYLASTNAAFLKDAGGNLQGILAMLRQSPLPSAALFFLIGGALEIIFEAFERRGTPGAPPPPEKQPPKKKPCVSDTKMIPIPGGSFMMGSEKGRFGSERPVHKVTLSPFSIDEHSVTVEQWSACLEEEKEPDLPPAHNVSKYPMTYVTWDRANDYCHSVGKRLPTEAEQEYVAKGPEHNFEYATRDGTEPTCLQQARCAANSPADVCSYRGNYVVWGGMEVCDMVGNVWEWGSDWYGLYSSEDAEDPQGPVDGQLKVMRGGSWVNVADYLRASYRNDDRPRNGNDDLGFRCVGVASPQDSKK